MSKSSLGSSIILKSIKGSETKKFESYCVRQILGSQQHFLVSFFSIIFYIPNTVLNAFLASSH